MTNSARRPCVSPVELTGGVIRSPDGPLARTPGVQMRDLGDGVHAWVLHPAVLYCARPEHVW